MTSAPRRPQANVGRPASGAASVAGDGGRSTSTRSRTACPCSASCQLTPRPCNSAALVGCSRTLRPCTTPQHTVRPCEATTDARQKNQCETSGEGDSWPRQCNVRALLAPSCTNAHCFIQRGQQEVLMSDLTEKALAASCQPLLCPKHKTHCTALSCVSTAIRSCTQSMEPLSPCQQLRPHFGQYRYQRIAACPVQPRRHCYMAAATVQAAATVHVQCSK